MVKTVLDNFCVKSGVFCPKCEEKISKGHVTELDLNIIKILCELEKEYPTLQDISFTTAVEAENVLAILVDKRDVGKILSQGGKIMRAINDRTGKTVRILSSGADDRQFIEDLLSPFSILTINTIWLPDESTETKAILFGRRPKRVPINFDIIKKLAKEIRGMTLRIEFERK